MGLETQILISSSPIGEPELVASKVPVYMVLESLMFDSREEVQSKLRISDSEYEASLAYASAKVRSVF